MPSKLGPEGKWVTVSLQLREVDVARLDAVRGESNRSEWCRPHVLAALAAAEGREAEPAPAVPVEGRPQRGARNPRRPARFDHMSVPGCAQPGPAAGGSAR